jgi:hypothetical protein
MSVTDFYACLLAAPTEWAAFVNDPRGYVSPEEPGSGGPCATANLVDDAERQVVLSQDPGRIRARLAEESQLADGPQHEARLEVRSTSANLGSDREIIVFMK